MKKLPIILLGILLLANLSYAEINETQLDSVMQQASIKTYADNSPIREWWDKLCFNYNYYVQTKMQGQYWIVVAASVLFLLLIYIVLKADKIKRRKRFYKNG